jgi:anti-sigma regulatory factor (Ser/Thr protein kinase)
VTPPAPASVLGSHAREIWISWDPGELKRVRRLAEMAAWEFGLDEERRFEFTFAANEAVSNAIEHGRPSPWGAIGITLERSDDVLSLSVRDWGTFQAELSPREDLADRGRGLAFVTAFVDDMRVRREPDGTVVELSVRRQ